MNTIPYKVIVHYKNWQFSFDKWTAILILFMNLPDLPIIKLVSCLTILLIIHVSYMGIESDSFQPLLRLHHDLGGKSATLNMEGPLIASVIGS